MTVKNNIFMLMTSFVLVLSACTNEDMSSSFDRTADGTIDLNVGVETSPANRAMTRADESTPASKYYAMKAGTQVRLNVDGTWAGKDPEAISKKTTCTTVAATDAAPTINALSFTENEKLYWDDYGTGDPYNKENTDKGLKVLGVAVDGLAEAPAVKDTEWESLSWPVSTDGKDVLNSDIIVSNNLYTEPYKFVKPTKDHVRNMIFVHPLSKITINLTAADGFTNGTETTYKFKEIPTLWLSKANTLEGVEDITNNYVLATGTINIQEAKAESDGKTSKVIAGTTSKADKKDTVTKQAVVYPGTQLGADDNSIIAVLNADDNIYFIKAKEIHDAIKDAGGHTDFKTLPGHNYIINITVRKSGIILTASVTKWINVEAAETHPEINIEVPIGDGSSDALPSGFNGFDLYLNDNNIAKEYTKAATPTVKDDGKAEFAKTLYWTHHYQHFHFRGIYPTGREVKTDDTDQYQYVEVENGAYDASTFPSNFVLGMPEIATGTMCNNPDHKDKEVDMSKDGICARKDAINLNFRYMMSQVEVKLKSSEKTADNYVDLTNAVVELVNIGTKGQILLGDRSAIVTEYEDTKALHGTSSTHYHDIIVPQSLENSKGKLKFKITVYSDDTKTKKDVYYATIADVKVKKKDSNTYDKTNAWKAGTYYVYELTITKTEIKATASLTDWVTVEGSEEVWF
jgi:hypothetical protein